MSEMVERVAKAIADNIQAGLPDGVTFDYGYAARAAIEAMRVPTDGMMDAFYNEDGTNSVAKWQAMIDAALKD